MSEQPGGFAGRSKAGRFTIETEQEEDGRWIAEVRELAGVMRYGRTRAEAIARAEALALRVLAERFPMSLVGQGGLDSAPH